jgi:hypothetical protein
MADGKGGMHRTMMQSDDLVAAGTCGGRHVEEEEVLW